METSWLVDSVMIWVWVQHSTCLVWCQLINVVICECARQLTLKDLLGVHQPFVLLLWNPPTLHFVLWNSSSLHSVAVESTVPSLCCRGIHRPFTLLPWNPPSLHSVAMEQWVRFRRNCDVSWKRNFNPFVWDSRKRVSKCSTAVYFVPKSSIHYVGQLLFEPSSRQWIPSWSPNRDKHSDTMLVMGGLNVGCRED